MAIKSIVTVHGFETMCYEVRCSSCGKTSWGGCGRHVASVYKRVPEDRRCLCREWPGVKAGDGGSGDKGSSTCTIL